jgi:hypothetical protein
LPFPRRHGDTADLNGKRLVAVGECACPRVDHDGHGGIHWRFDQIGGNVLGRAVATAVVKNNLRPVHP